MALINYYHMKYHSHKLKTFRYMTLEYQQISFLYLENFALNHKATLITKIQIAHSALQEEEIRQSEGLRHVSADRPPILIPSN